MVIFIKKKSLKKNKNAIGFFSLIGPFLLILFATLMIVSVNPANKAPEKILYGDSIQAIDRINNKIPAQEFYLKESLENILEKKKDEYTIDLGYKDDEYRDNNPSDGGGKTDVYLGCKYGGVELWYNEKNEAENKIIISNAKSGADSSSDDIDDEGVVKVDSELGVVGEGELYSNCKLSITEDFEASMKDDLKDELEIQIREDLKSLDLSQINVEVDFDKEKDQVVVNSRYSNLNDISNIYLDLTTSADVNLGIYPQLLIALNTVVENIQVNMEKKVFPCFEKADNSEKYCIEQGFLDMVSDENPNLLNYYDFDIKMFWESDDTGVSINAAELDGANIINSDAVEYYRLEVKVMNKRVIASDTNEVLSFGIILKDNVPYDLLSFDLKNHGGLDNVITANILEPRQKIKDKITSYIILYSYENFFSSSYSKYEELKKMLKNNEIPKKFEKAGFSDACGNAYAYSNKDSGLDLNLILVPNNDECKDKSVIGSDVFKGIDIYQTYNHNSEVSGYELLESGKEVFVYIFATDVNFNYYVEDDDMEIDSLVPNTVFGPSPLIATDVTTLTGDKEDSQNSIFFSIEGYEDPSFDHYDLYLLSSGSTGVGITRCEDDSNCYYLDGSGLLTSKNTNYVITDEIVQDDTIQISPQRFSPSNKLSIVSGNYELYIVPVNKDGKGISSGVASSSRLEKPIGSDHFSIVTKNGLTYEPFSSSVDVVDNKKPDPMTSIIIGGITADNNGKYSLIWRPSLGETDITAIFIEGAITFTDGTPVEFIKIENGVSVGLDNILFENKQNVASISISKILPYDGSNGVDFGYFGETQFANYP